jgi:hypothetical protein
VTYTTDDYQLLIIAYCLNTSVLTFELNLNVCYLDNIIENNEYYSTTDHSSHPILSKR